MSEDMDTSGSAAQMEGDAAAVAEVVGSQAPVNPTADADAVAEAVGAKSNQESTWNFADDVPGTGDIPEWFKANKYKNVAEQAKAYAHLESKLGAFTGAPEEYADAQLNEELVNMGIEIDKEDGLYQDALEFAKSLNMNQDGFNKMIELYAMNQVAEQKAIENHRADQIKELGTHAEQRINNINAWAKRHLAPDMIEGLNEMATSANAIKTIEHLIAKSRPSQVAPNNAQPVGGVTEAEVRAMQFEKDANGNRKIAVDPEFRRRFEEAAAQVYGGGEHRIMVGGS